MNREYQQQRALSPVVVNQNRVVVLDTTMLQQPIHPTVRCRQKYQRRNSKVGKMFFESDISGSTATSESACSTATPLPTFEAPILADAASTISATACDTTIMPLDTHTSVRKSLHSIIRPSKYGTTCTNAAAVSQSSYASDVKTMRRSWGHVPQLSGSSMSSVEEIDLTSCRGGGASCTTTGYRFGRSSPTDQFCYDTECPVCCESMKIHIDR